MKILITGSEGQLGNELRRCLEAMEAEIGPIGACYSNAQVDYADYQTLDMSDIRSIDAWFDKRGPYDLVVNCAAITNVDGCELDEAGAYRVNAHGAEHLARACESCKAKFVHISTDYVFPGDDPEPREEGDQARPISAYGRTKWAGEVLVSDVCSRVFVIRTAWLYGYSGKNFVKTMMRLARECGKISVVADQFGNPTSANDLAYEILRIAETSNYGIYHCTNEGACSWFDFASAIVDSANIPCEKESLTSAEYKKRFPQAASRPAYSSLRNKHLEETIGNEMRPWREALDDYLSNLGA